MNNILTLERRGCNFFKGDNINNFSDVGNYRVGVYTYSIKGKDGRDYMVEFGKCTHYRYRNTHKVTGHYRYRNTHKVTGREVIVEYGLHLDTQFEDGRGCRRNRKLEREVWEMHLPYTKEGILTAVNYISARKYDGIVIK